MILCLPDEAAREAVTLIESPDVTVIDASTAHRVADGWTYGFAEMAPDQTAAIRASNRISNPGCYSTAAIALLRPLIDAGLLPPTYPVTINGVSGYTGGGRAMVAEFEDEQSQVHATVPFRLYGLGLGHKHVPEITVHSGLRHAPIFSPAVGRYAQGMLVEIPLPLWAIPGEPSLAAIHGALEERYAGQKFVEVASMAESAALKTLDPEGLNGTNFMRLHVFGDPAAGQARLVALLDNLGKGAAGAAVQNLNLVIGAAADKGL